MTQFPHTRQVDGQAEFICPLCKEVIGSDFSCTCGYELEAPDLAPTREKMVMYLETLRALQNAINAHIEVFERQEFTNPSWHRECGESWNILEGAIITVVTVSGRGIAMKIL
jgi:hypothetical protein